MKFSDKISSLCSQTGATAKSLLKILLQSRRSTVTVRQEAIDGKPLIIMGNGPSLGDLIRDHQEALADSVTMALNFAANADEFSLIRPKLYLLADPHFFDGRDSDPNVGKMFSRFNELVDWPMTLYVPTGHSARSLAITNQKIKVENFNFTGAEGFGWFENAVFKAGLAMPRPRNVLVPAIMTGLRAGFHEIYVAGADHGWLTTLSVTEENEVVSIQPHFYKDNSSEQKRVASVYRNVRLHDILLSFHLAFKSYHRLQRYAAANGYSIFNSTPGSFIDAFERRGLPFKK
ncbi:MAG: hypothetical protein NC212_07940 [Staphylococcus sp.]|nr:hypothetical protein [Staphylococcus sp.]